MLAVMAHRGPDDRGYHVDGPGRAMLGQNRLSIIDLSSAGHQPMPNQTRDRWLAFNGEIYNYVELRQELRDYPYRSGSDTEVLLAAWERWGEACLDRLIGMFAFLLWDERERKLFGARDRFGVKPLYYSENSGELICASEIKALHAAGVDRSQNESTWARYLTTGASDCDERTFWRGVEALPAGHCLSWQDGSLRVRRWYDLAARVGTDYDSRPEQTVLDEYQALMTDSVRLRFRSDVPVGVNLSGGLDSAMLAGTIRAVQGDDAPVTAYTFITNDPNYDELPWVNQMLGETGHRATTALLAPDQVPDLAARIAEIADEPYGGLPTLAYAQLFARARQEGTIVLLDGQGLDEQWGGYDYYAKPEGASLVQGTTSSPVRPETLTPEFQAAATPFVPAAPFPDRLRNLQYRDICFTKIPRALRFNDRVSMASSTELREPFLDHRLVELAFRQPPERKIAGGIRKKGLRQIAQRLVPSGIVEAPKRPLQTPQREWLRGPLASWAEDQIETALRRNATWFDAPGVRRLWRDYLAGAGDNSFYVWQWISAGMSVKPESVLV